MQGKITKNSVIPYAPCQHQSYRGVFVVIAYKNNQNQTSLFFKIFIIVKNLMPANKADPVSSKVPLLLGIKLSYLEGF